MEDLSQWVREARWWVRRCWCCGEEENEHVRWKREVKEDEKGCEEEVMVEELSLRKSRSSTSLPPADVSLLVSCFFFQSSITFYSAPVVTFDWLLIFDDTSPGLLTVFSSSTANLWVFFFTMCNLLSFPRFDATGVFKVSELFINVLGWFYKRLKRSYWSDLCLCVSAASGHGRLVPVIPVGLSVSLVSHSAGPTVPHAARTQQQRPAEMENLPERVYLGQKHITPVSYFRESNPNSHPFLS